MNEDKNLQKQKLALTMFWTSGSVLALQSAVLPLMNVLRPIQAAAAQEQSSMTLKFRWCQIRNTGQPFRSLYAGFRHNTAGAMYLSLAQGVSGYLVSQGYNQQVCSGAMSAADLLLYGFKDVQGIQVMLGQPARGLCTMRMASNYLPYALARNWVGRSSAYDVLLSSDSGGVKAAKFTGSLVATYVLDSLATGAVVTNNQNKNFVSYTWSMIRSPKQMALRLRAGFFPSLALRACLQAPDYLGSALAKFFGKWW